MQHKVLLMSVKTILTPSITQTKLSHSKQSGSNRKFRSHINRLLFSAPHLRRITDIPVPALIVKKNKKKNSFRLTNDAHAVSVVHFKQCEIKPS